MKIVVYLGKGGECAKLRQRSYLLGMGVAAATAPVRSLDDPFDTSRVIDDHFDDRAVRGWSTISNGRAKAVNATEDGSALASEVVARWSYANAGLVSTDSISPTKDGGLILRFEVAGIEGNAIAENGLFLRLVNSHSRFYRWSTVSSFGLSIFGSSTPTMSNNGVALVANDRGIGAATNGSISNAQPKSLQRSDLRDGFVAEIVVDPQGWSYKVEGGSGTAKTVSGQGTWAEAGTDLKPFSPTQKTDTSWWRHRALS